MKVLTILCDGMRPDSFMHLPEAQALLAKSSYDLKAQTVFPSVTLPCHLSLFHSVTPERHNNMTNTYTPMVRPVMSMLEQLHWAHKTNAMFYSWEELRDMCRGGMVDYSEMISCYSNLQSDPTGELTDHAIDYIAKYRPDFTFLYMHDPDGAGHGKGWMSQEYMDAVAYCWKNIERIIATLDDEYVVFVMADHGGHDRMHGTLQPEDMTIPIIAYGTPFDAGKELSGLSILDVAPTIVTLLGVEIPRDWEGRSLV